MDTIVLRDLIRRNFYSVFSVVGDLSLKAGGRGRWGDYRRPGNTAWTGGVGWQPGEFCKKLIHHLSFNKKRTSGVLNS